MQETIKKKRISHGLKNHRIYDVWKGIVKRTSNVNCKDFKDYGGRGISVCERWKDVRNFVGDMYPSYEEGLSIDRINVEGNYEPSNCRWATKSVQARNTQRLRSDNKSGYRGVYYNSSKRIWRAQISVSCKRIFIGSYKTALEAAIAYDTYVIGNKLEHTTNGVLKLA